MVRVGALFALALSCLSCGPIGATCGRGRCRSGTVCHSIFGDGRSNQGWNDQSFPNVDNEWWCERDCPSGKGCSGRCLEDPANDEVVVCAVDRVNLVYYSAGKSCLCAPGGGNMCAADSAVSGLEVTDTCTQTRTVLATCIPKMDCPTGMLHAGDMVPGVRLFFAGNGYEYIYCPGQPDNQLGPLLPEGQTVRIYPDRDTCN